MDIEEIVRQTLLMLIGSCLCLILLDRKYSLKKTLTIYGIATVFIIVFNLSFLTLFGVKTFYSFYPIIVNGTTLVTLFYLSKRKGIPVIFTMLTVVNIAAAITLPTYYLKPFSWYSIWIEIPLKIVITLLIILLLYRYLRPAYLKMLTVIQKGWGYLCLIPGLYYALVLPNIVIASADITENRQAFTSCILALLIVIVTYGVIFVLLAKTLRETEMQDEQELLKSQMEAMERHANMLKKNEEKVRIYHHDMRHYIAEIKVLLESGNKSEALRILEQLDEQNRAATVPHYCDNPTVNAVLVYYIQKAEQEGIAVDVDCRMSEMLSAEASELAAVLANAIENAIYACGKVPKGRELIIKITLISSPQLALEVTHSYAGKVAFDESGFPVSAEIGHTPGTKGIYAFVEKHDGIIEYSADDTLFRLRLLVGS